MYTNTNIYNFFLSAFFHLENATANTVTSMVGADNSGLSVGGNISGAKEKYIKLKQGKKRAVLYKK